jgi:hypothetical protein
MPCCICALTAAAQETSASAFALSDQAEQARAQALAKFQVAAAGGVVYACQASALSVCPCLRCLSAWLLGHATLDGWSAS